MWGIILEAEPTEFLHRLGLIYEGKRGAKDDSEVLGLIN